jgi:hypothetical protein
LSSTGMVQVFEHLDKTNFIYQLFDYCDKTFEAL